MPKKSEMKVLELFAGVGGFRIGLEHADKNFYKTPWSNQFEPTRKSQDAFQVYNYRFPDSDNINTDINKISDAQFKKMDADLIVGGFPCQDYSVARSKKGEMGIKGKKGILFWQIIRAIEDIHPKYLILENVNRLLKAPSKQRGRDFSVMLSAFNNLGYSVEWRIINAADYGFAQRRRRVYLFVYRNDLPYAKKVDHDFENDKHQEVFRYNDYIYKDGLFAHQFPVKNFPNKKRIGYNKLPNDIVKTSDSFKFNYYNAGVMRNGRIFTIDTIPDEEKIDKDLKVKGKKRATLGDVVQPENQVDESKYITDPARLKKIQYMRGSKKIERTSKDGHKYFYSEGGMSPYDKLSLPSRTMLTSEGTLNRSTHYLKINGKLRVLTPVEAERLQYFPDNWTKYKIVDGKKEEVSDRMRMFFMGNALVTEIIKRIGIELEKIDNKNKKTS